MWYCCTKKAVRDGAHASASAQRRTCCLRRLHVSGRCVSSTAGGVRKVYWPGEQQQAAQMVRARVQGSCCGGAGPRTFARHVSACDAPLRVHVCAR
jgi:hypothetical protein